MAAERRRVLALTALLVVFFLSVYLFVGSSDLNHNGDTDLRYQTTQAIVDHHRLWIAQPMWLDTRVAKGIGGHLYAFYAPGQTVLMVPLYIAGRFLAHHLGLPYEVTTLYSSRSLDLFLGTFLVVLFFLMAHSVGYSLRASLLVSVVFGLATPVLPDAQSALEQTQVDLCLLLSVFALLTFVKSGLHNRRWLVLAGCAAGFGFFTRYDFALFVPILALYLVAMRTVDNRIRLAAGDLGAFIAGLLPWAVMLAGWNMARFGNPLQTGLHERTLGEPFIAGLLGLTVSPGKGILWYMPLIFLLPWCVGNFYRRRPSLAILMALLVAVPLLFYANVVYWHGDPAWGPRYLYTSLPYLALPLGELFTTWRARARLLQVTAALLIALSIALQASAASVTQWRFWYRLEAQEEHTSQPFRWGAAHYHYYWNVGQSPILMQFDDVYQVFRLTALGDRRYQLTARPTRCTHNRCPSNPADNYPVNTLAFWWADTRHPLLGGRTRGVIAGGLALSALLSLCLLLYPLGVYSRAGKSPSRSTRLRGAESLSLGGDDALQG